MKLDLVGTRKWFFLVSGVLVVASLILLAIPPSLRPGIEFTSGTTTLIEFERNVDQADIREVYAQQGHEEARIQSTGSNQFLIRTDELDVPPGSFTDIAPEPEDDVNPVGPAPLENLGTLVLGAEGQEYENDEVLLRAPFQGDVCRFGAVEDRLPVGTEVTVAAIHEQCGTGDEVVYRVATDEAVGLVQAADTRDFTPADEPEEAPADQGERTVIENALEEEFGAFEVLEFASVSPVVSALAVRNATIAVAVASLFIMGYVAFAFASVPRPFRYAACSIIALLHDVIIVLGAFSLFGKVFGTEVNLMFITGLLTVIGFSVHDSIVVFDRIRENVRLSPNALLRDNVNAALLQTMSRSMNTSITLLLTVVAMLLLGGVTIQSFLLVILVGVIAGTYSSIGVAAQLLVAWEEGDLARLFGRGRGVHSRRRADRGDTEPERARSA